MCKEHFWCNSRLERIFVIEWYTITRGFPCDSSPFIYVCMNVLFMCICIYIVMGHNNSMWWYQDDKIYNLYTQNELGLKNDDTYRWDVFLFGLSHNTWEPTDTWKMKIFINLLILNLNLPFLWSAPILLVIWGHFFFLENSYMC